MYKSFPLRKMQGMNATWNRYLRHSNYESKILPGFLCSRVESLAETLSVTPLVSLPRREKLQIFTVKQRSKDSNLHCSLSRFRTKMGRKPVAYLNNCDREAPFPSCPAHTQERGLWKQPMFLEGWVGEWFQYESNPSNLMKAGRGQASWKLSTFYEQIE